MTPIETWQKIGPVLLKRYKRSKTFLDYQTPWQLLVAVVLSAQTTDNHVNKITPALFKKYPTAKAMAKASVADITHYIKTVGYFNAKARHLKAAAEMVDKKFKGVVPDNQKIIQEIPGVGRKSAVAIISNAYNKNIGIPVDTHVIRFAKRFNLSKHADPSKIEQDLLKVIPKKDWKRAGYAIKEYGRREGRALRYKPELDPLQTALTNGN